MKTLFGLFLEAFPLYDASRSFEKNRKPSFLGIASRRLFSARRLSGDRHALHASGLPGEGSEVHRQGSYATRETKE